MIFEPHISAIEYAKGLKSGIIIKGILHVFSKRPMDAVVKPVGPYGIALPSRDLEDDIECSKNDIIVSGSMDRNRAIHGDIVGVKLKTKDELAKKLKTTDAIFQDRLLGHVMYVEKMTGPKKSYFAVLRSNRPESANSKLRVLHCTDTPDFRPELFVDWKAEPAIKAIPIDRRIPWLRLEKKHIEELARQSSDGTPFAELGKSDMLPEFEVFRVELSEWRESWSIPKGQLLSHLGKLGDPASEEIIALATTSLMDHTEPFSEEVEEYAKKIVEKSAKDMPEIRKKRVDMSSSNTFTIDPIDATDLDDAVSIKRKTNHVEISVHVADVSYFVEAGNPLDNVARTRTRTLYLPHKAYHMLPSRLCQEAASLLPGVLRLAFTCTFSVDHEGHILETPSPRFYKSVVQSRYKLNYEQVQRIFDDEPSLTENVTKSARSILTHSIPITTASGNTLDELVEDRTFRKEQLKEDLILLRDITQKIRKIRFEAGSISIDKVQLRFSCQAPFEQNVNTINKHIPQEDSASLGRIGMPVSVHQVKHTASQHLIEELMLIANKLVAQRLLRSPLSQLAVCRYHRKPDQQMRMSIANFLSPFNVDFDANSSKAIQTAMNEVWSKRGPRLGIAFQQIVMKFLLQQARYDVYGSTRLQDPSHFALAFDSYTHFTSPIRRYPDIMTHRLLNCVLNLEERGIISAVDLRREGENTEEVRKAVEQFGFCSIEAASKQCHICNQKNARAKEMEDKLNRSWILMYLLNSSHPRGTIVTVMAVEDKSMSVFIIELYVTARIEYQGKDSTRLKSRLSTLYSISVEPPSEFRCLKGECDIIWSDTLSIHVKPYDEVPAWILPSQDIPIGFLVIPIPPNHPDYMPLIQQELHMST